MLPVQGAATVESAAAMEGQQEQPQQAQPQPQRQQEQPQQAQPNGHVETSKRGNVSFHVDDLPEDDDEENFFTEKRRASTGGDGVSASFSAKQEKRAFADASIEIGGSKGRLRRETAIPIDFVIEKIDHSINSSELATDLLIFIPFLVLFVFFFLAGRDVESNYYVLKGVRDYLFYTEYPNVPAQLQVFQDEILAEMPIYVEPDKKYADVGNAGDWVAWMQDSVVTNTWDCAHPNVSRPLLSPRGQDYHIGAMRVRTQRMRSDSCAVAKELLPPNASDYPKNCWSSGVSNSLQETGPWCNFTSPLDPKQKLFRHSSCSSLDRTGTTVVGVEQTYDCGGYIVDLPFNATCDDIMAVVAIFADPNCFYVDGWATRFVSIEFFVYTPSTDTFHSIKMYTEIPAGGFWFNQWYIRSFQVWTQSKTALIAVDIFFILYVLYYWIAFFWDLVIMYRREGKILKFFVQFWNILELANLITFVAVFVIRYMWMSLSRSATHIKFPFAAEYPKDMDRLCDLFVAQIYANSVNTILTFLKFLKYVRLNGRLNVLTRTIAICQQSIFGVLVLFVFVVLGYGITAWTLFGINIDGFRNLGVAMSSLVRMLVGDIDYEEMRAENRFLAGAFFWSYLILALFLLLNFIIAIISDSFAKVSGKAFVQSLDEVLLRQWQFLRLYFHPQNLKRLCVGCVTRNGEAKLLALALEDLRAAKELEVVRLTADRDVRNEERRALARNEDDLVDIEEEDVVVMMKAEHWKSWVSQETYERLGAIFFDYTWDEIMNDFDDAKKSSEEVDKRMMVETVQTSVERVVGDDMRKVDQLDEMLTSLEVEISKIIQALKRK